MSNTYEIEIEAQPSIYKPQERSIKVYFSEPQKGIDKDTGVLLLLAGYGGHATSNVFTKMRDTFSDKYNLVVVQCEYFGYEFMQNCEPPNISNEMLIQELSDAELELLQKDYDKYAHILQGKVFKQYVDCGETKEYFNDMGLMQAIDNLRSVKVVLDILENNHYLINENRIYVYGFSHGGYLAYLCNALWPELFTGIVDNSGYIVPYYLKNARLYDECIDGIQIRQITIYKASEFVGDEQILDLTYLYQKFDNNANIICFAGEDDYMTSLEEKKAFLNNVNHSRVETITKYRVDREIFQNTDHGMGADFIKLFDATYKTFIKPKEDKQKRSKSKHRVSCNNVCYETDFFRYEVRWEEGIPILYRTEL